ncbi:MAG: hypothetical protein AAGH15_16205 [Myxococcota bacterium]
MDPDDEPTKGGAPVLHALEGGPQAVGAHPDWVPDVRDGLTRVERVILWQLSVLQEERRGKNVSTAQLYGRVVEHVDLSVRQFQRILGRMTGKGGL